MKLCENLRGLTVEVHLRWGNDGRGYATEYLFQLPAGVDLLATATCCLSVTALQLVS